MSVLTTVHEYNISPPLNFFFATHHIFFSSMLRVSFSIHTIVSASIFPCSPIGSHDEKLSRAVTFIIAIHGSFVVHAGILTSLSVVKSIPLSVIRCVPCTSDTDHVLVLYKVITHFAAIMVVLNELRSIVFETR